MKDNRRRKRKGLQGWKKQGENIRRLNWRVRPEEIVRHLLKLQQWVRVNMMIVGLIDEWNKQWSPNNSFISPKSQKNFGKY